MINNYPYLNDYQFLKEFDNHNHKTQKVKITILDFKENPIKEIQGRVTSGSVNIDGSSAIRRTCNISLIADDYGANLTNINNLLSINKKVSIEIGFKNTFLKYREFDYIWFPLGVFVIFNPTCTHSKDGLNISFQGKDKMCLLNGECGGTLPAAVIFHEQEEKNDLTGMVTITKPLVFNIIKELVNHFGGESLHNILISDVPTMIKRVLKWNGDDVFYLVKGNDGKDYYYPVFKEEDLKDGDYGEYFQKKQEIGYEYTEFSYPGELMGNAGDSVCTILDKIKNTLGNYEYYYDVNGIFVFQEIKNFLNTTESKTILNKLSSATEDQYKVNLTTGKAAYTFETHNLIESFSNAPQYAMIKNDFLVWGERKNAQGNPVPIRYHLAIDKKPQVGNNYKVGFYIEPETNILKAKPVTTLAKGKKEIENKFNVIYEEKVSIEPITCAIDTLGIYLNEESIKFNDDFYEVAYTLSLIDIEDINNLNTKLDSTKRYLVEVRENNKHSLKIDNDFIIEKKGNEWRLLEKKALKKSLDVYYQPRNSRVANLWIIFKEDVPKYFEYYPEVEGNRMDFPVQDIYNIKTKDWREELYYSGLFASINGTDTNHYFAELANEWPKLWNLKEQRWNCQKIEGDNIITESGTELDYFLDFIDVSENIGVLNVDNIGRRTKIVSDNSVNCIFEPDPPNIIWRKVGDMTEIEKDFYTNSFTENDILVQIPEQVYVNMISGGNYNSAFLYIRDLLVQHTNYNESITVVSQPIYYLEPNTLVAVNDIKSGIQGEYLVKSFSIPLATTGNMSLSCVKVLDKI